jgi:hypothetical protein
MDPSVGGASKETDSMTAMQTSEMGSSLTSLNTSKLPENFETVKCTIFTQRLCVLSSEI